MEAHSHRSLQKKGSDESYLKSLGTRYVGCYTNIHAALIPIYIGLKQVFIKMFTKDYEMKADFSSPAVLRAVQGAEMVSAPSVGEGSSISYFVGVTH